MASSRDATRETPCLCGRYPEPHKRQYLCGIGFNEFLGEVQHRLLKAGYNPPLWPQPKIRDMGDVDEALDVCVQWCKDRLDGTPWGPQSESEQIKGGREQGLHESREAGLGQGMPSSRAENEAAGAGYRSPTPSAATETFAAFGRWFDKMPNVFNASECRIAFEAGAAWAQSLPSATTLTMPKADEVLLACGEMDRDELACAMSALKWFITKTNAADRTANDV